MARLEGAGGPDYSSFRVGSASGDERVTIVDRAFELLYRRGTGPIAGRAMQARREQSLESSGEGIDGFAGINVLPPRNVAILALAAMTGVALLASKALVGKVVKK